VFCITWAAIFDQYLYTDHGFSDADSGKYFGQPQAVYRCHNISTPVTDVTIALSELEWTSGQGVHTVGKAFLDNELLETADLHRSFRGISSYEAFRELVSNLNGQFAVIVHTDEEVWMGVDHIRTHPLFYTVFDDEIYVGDNFPVIDGAIEFKKPDQVSAMEFVAAGYPSGSYTLHPDIKKVCAGEILRIKTSNQNPIVETEEYFRYRHNPSPIDSEEKLLELMDEALTNAFERAIKIINGRKVLLPLTGGYDSRLVGLMLRDQGYDNVHTFCHNLEDDIDLKISQQVASDLGYSWQGMNHTEEELDKVRQSEEWLSLWNDIGGYGSIYPSSRHLLTYDKATQAFDQDTEFVLLRGDTAAAPGGFMPDFFDSTTASQKQTAINTIFDYHYNFCVWNRRKHSSTLQKRITESVPRNNINTKEEMVDLIEYWYWHERTPNRLLPHPLMLHRNQILGWFPLWDKEFVQIMSLIPFKYRFDKELYRNYIHKKYMQVTGDRRNTDREKKTTSTTRSIQHTFGKHFVGTFTENSLRSIKNTIDYTLSDDCCDLNTIGEKNITIRDISSGYEKTHWMLRNRR